jgi:hypothetical protein
VRTRGGNGGNAEIDTPAAAIVVNGAADVRVDVDGTSGRTFIAVRFGARTSTRRPRASTSRPARRRASTPTAATTRSVAPARGRVRQLRYARDTRWREPRYVSSEMTGYEDLDSYGTWQPAAEYGNVWFPRQIATDWVPYRDGRWVWVEPWGWTWVDNAPWGFAPFHYGRWVQVNNRWGWWPGERVRDARLRARAGRVLRRRQLRRLGDGRRGPAVGWFPLGTAIPTSPGTRPRRRTAAT